MTTQTDMFVTVRHGDEARMLTAAEVESTPMPESPYVKTHATSRDAAAAADGRAPSLRERVYIFISSQGDMGATDDEIQQHLGLGSQTECPRRRELEKAGRIRATHETRPTRKGGNAVVWVSV